LTIFWNLGYIETGLGVYEKDFSDTSNNYRNILYIHIYIIIFDYFP